MKTANTTETVTVKPWVWVAGSIVLLTSLGVIVWYRNKKNKEAEDEGEWEESSGSYVHNTSGSSTSSSSSSPKPSSAKRGPFRCEKKTYPLSYGTCHPDVAVLQRYLKSRNANLGTSGSKRDGVDGKFGSMTEKAAIAKTGKSSFSQTDIQGMKRSLNLITS